MKKCKKTYVYYYNDRLVVKAMTWTKETADLYDYENRDSIEYDKTISSDAYILRDGNSIKVDSEMRYERVDEADTRIIAYMDCNESDYFYMSRDYNLNGSTAEQSWINLKSLKNNKYLSGYILHQGDVIKFGRIKLKVRDICMNGKQTSALSGIGMNSKKIVIPTILSIKDKDGLIKKKICRICYCDDQEIDSPLITPCKCSGGLKYIHYSCLQQWLKTRADFHQATSTENCIIYQIKQANCEICHSSFPDFLREGNNLYEIFDFIECTFKNYIAFESIPRDDNDHKKIYLLGFDNKNVITVGRSHETDLRITDISVSRLHAKIMINNDNTLLLQDGNSKFGSLALLQHPRLRILPLSPLSLQIGRTLLTISIKRESCVCNFFSKTEAMVEDYGTANSAKIAIEKILVIQDHELSHYSKSATSDMEKNPQEEEDAKMTEDNNPKNSERSAVPSTRKLIIKPTNILVMGMKTKGTIDYEHEGVVIDHGRNDGMDRVVEERSEEVGYKEIPRRNENNCSFENPYDKGKENMNMIQNHKFKKRRSCSIDDMSLNVRKYLNNIHDGNANANNNNTTMKNNNKIIVFPVSPISKIQIKQGSH